MSKVDYIVSAGGGVYLPAIIIIHSTNVETIVELCQHFWIKKIQVVDRK